MDKYDVAAFFVVVLAVVAIILLFGSILFIGSSHSCKEQWPQKYKPEFGFFSGCTIEHNGERIPSANFRAF